MEKRNVATSVREHDDGMDDVLSTTAKVINDAKGVVKKAFANIEEAKARALKARLADEEAEREMIESVSK